MTDVRSGTPSPTSEPQSPAPLRWRTLAPLIAAALAMQSAAWLLMIAVAEIARDAYGFFSFSDIAGTYYPYALRMAAGMAAYRDFFIEYPPLFVPLLAAVGKPVSPSDFLVRFAVLMVVFMLAAGVVTTLAAVDGRSSVHPYAAAAVFSALVLALGPIAANRYDAVVACVLALALLFTMREDWELAGIALGIGFALKITPAMLLPLVLMLAPARRAARALVGFSVAALAPFVWVALMGGQSGARLAEMIGYHLARPLEIESVLATGLWVGRLAGPKLAVATSSGSQVIVSGSAVTIASVSTYVLLAALALTFALVWRRRATILAEPRLIALASLATMLGSLAGSKVLSPQYFVWIIPAAALVALDRKVLVGILAIALLMTHALFPANYLAFAYDQLAGPILLVVARNLLVVGAFALSLWYLWSLPDVRQNADA